VIDIEHVEDELVMMGYAGEQISSSLQQAHGLSEQPGMIHCELKDARCGNRFDLLVSVLLSRDSDE